MCKDLPLFALIFLSLILFFGENINDPTFNISSYIQEEETRLLHELHFFDTKLQSLQTKNDPKSNLTRQNLELLRKYTLDRLRDLRPLITIYGQTKSHN